MSKKAVFLSAPISGFLCATEYSAFREKTVALINHLDTYFDVCSEICEVVNKKDYDSPQQSAIDDFNQIDCADLFLLLHPCRLQTSSLIELGYAYGKCKPIVIVGKKEDLPYLALGIVALSDAAVLIESSDIDGITLDAIINAIESLLQ